MLKKIGEEVWALSPHLLSSVLTDEHVVMRIRIAVRVHVDRLFVDSTADNSAEQDDTGDGVDNVLGEIFHSRLH